MKTLLKLISCILLVSFFAIQFKNVNVKAQEQEIDWMDDFLIGIGMSQELIAALPEETKQIMCEYLDENAEFVSYTTQYITWDENGDINVASDLSDNVFAISLATAKTQISGELAYAFFPSFNWSKVTKIKNDSFSFALYPGWGIVDFEEATLRVSVRNSYGDVVQGVSLSPTSADDRAMSFKFSDIGSVDVYFEGHGVFYAKDAKGNAMPSMYLHYFHDDSFSRNIKYDILLPSLVVSGASSNSYGQKLVNLTFSK